MSATKNTIGGLLVGLSLLGAANAMATPNNFEILETLKQQGTPVMALTTEEKATVQGENWGIVVRLLKANVKIYGRVGWELGRLTAMRKYGVDPGPYPGLARALSGRF